MRLDKYLLEKFNVETRSKALRMIKNGYVQVNGKTVFKGGLQVSDDDYVEIKEDPYVSRAAWKLKTLFDVADIDVKNKLCLDVGSSTGGFTQVLLENGAALVVAVDVGSNQLHSSLRENSRVISLENVDIREFRYLELFDVLVCDVSFISASSLFKTFNSLVKGGGDIIVLFKPQFEVGKNCRRNKKGVIMDELCIQQAKKRFETEALKHGWALNKALPAKIKGKSGNQEFIYWFKR